MPTPVGPPEENNEAIPRLYMMLYRQRKARKHLSNKSRKVKKQQKS